MAKYRRMGGVDFYQKEPEGGGWIWIVVILFFLLVIFH